MNGYKTYIGGAIIAFCALAGFIGWLDDAQISALMRLGEAFGLIGIGHKIAKAAT